MSRISLFAFLIAASLSTACGSSPGATSDDDNVSVDDGGVSHSGGRKDSGGKKPSSAGPSSNDDSESGGSAATGPDKMLTPTSVPFNKDATDAAGLPGDIIKKLKDGGGSCTAKILYPYDNTIFPAGLLPPTIMWDGMSDGAYVKLTYDKLDTLSYEAAAGPKDKGELNIDPADWDQIVRRTQSSTRMLVTLNTMSGGKVSSCGMTWKIAQGAMTGSIFYNTYDSPDSNGQGAVVRLTLGEATSQVYLQYQGNALPGNGPCISCHSVSANGASLAASLHNYTPTMQSYSAASYAVSSTPEPAPMADLSDSTFGGFTPDGTRILGIGNPECTKGGNSFPRAPNNFPSIKGPTVATLHDTQTGKEVPATGLDKGRYMWMPQFSPKGDKVAFNHAKMGADGRTDRRELAVMDFDSATNTFSNLVVVVSNQGPEPTLDYAPMPTGLPDDNAGNNCDTTVSSDVGAIKGGSCEGPCYPAWPFFTPDGEGLVYALVSEPDFMSAFPGRDRRSKSELWYLDIDTKVRVRLDTAAKGLGDDDDLSNYYPTMLPVQVGGYYWMFWTSTRAWGHRELTPAPTAGANVGSMVLDGLGLGGIPGVGASSLNAKQKRIWVSAIKPRAMTEVGFDEISDTSSPGFYLEGQSDSGNVRAFATLNPCKNEGSDCTSGLDCCTGLCKIPDGAEVGSCVPEKTCSDVNEKCTKNEDCCPAPDGQQQRLCIGDYCGFMAL